MKKYWPVLRTSTYIIIGLLNTAFIKSEDIGTWKNYVGYFFLTLVMVDVVVLFIKKKKNNVEITKN